MMSQKRLIVANWKMNKTVKESVDCVKKIKGSKTVQVVVAPSFVSLYPVNAALKGRQIKLCAQNTHYLDSGDFTGEISPAMIKDVGCEYVIIGHSERRRFFNEDEDFINSKILVSLSYGLKVILCIGETLEAMRANINEDYLAIQLSRNLLNIKKLENVIIAYEPVWAVSSNVTASVSHITKMQAFIKKYVYANFGLMLPVLYGGNINPENCTEIIKLPNVDGLMVGDASLDYRKLNKIIKVTEDL